MAELLITHFIRDAVVIFLLCFFVSALNEWLKLRSRKKYQRCLANIKRLEAENERWGRYLAKLLD